MRWLDLCSSNNETQINIEELVKSSILSRYISNVLTNSIDWHGPTCPPYLLISWWEQVIIISSLRAVQPHWARPNWTGKLLTISITGYIDRIIHTTPHQEWIFFVSVEANNANIRIISLVRFVFVEIFFWFVNFEEFGQTGWLFLYWQSPLLGRDKDFWREYTCLCMLVSLVSSVKYSCNNPLYYWY